MGEVLGFRARQLGLLLGLIAAFLSFIFLGIVLLDGLSGDGPSEPGQDDTATNNTSNETAENQTDESSTITFDTQKPIRSDSLRNSVEQSVSVI